MGFRKKKGTCGEATKFITRNKACKLLQIRLADFRRLCILKGIYPREPKNRKKAQKGDNSIKTLYLKKDIIYLSHEPIIWKIREEKIYKRKLKSLLGKMERETAEHHRKVNRPTYKVDHIVLERYPDFKRALQDLDDPLSTCFLYSMMPNLSAVVLRFVEQSRKMTVDFMNYVIEARSLRKVFISFKGYFYRAHINGEQITWMVPHPFTPEKVGASDLRIMNVFMEFYCTMLGFVNFKLYQSLNLHYPPKFSEAKGSKNCGSKLYFKEGINVLEALNRPLARGFVDSEQDDDYDPKLLNPENDKKLRLAQEELMKVKLQMALFEGVKFYLGRETNRESLTFVIRSCGGLVSWDKTAGPGWTYSEDDKDIKYQIVDRPEIEKKHLSRYYIQPQWVYDSFNAGMLLPVQDYFVGAALPAHLSPFEETFKDQYTPPEMEKLRALQNKIKLAEVEGENSSDEETSEEADDKEERKITKVKGSKKREEKYTAENENDEDPLERMKVIQSRPAIVNPTKEMKEKEDFDLASSFIHKRQQFLFKRILKKEKNQEAWGVSMRKKRILYEQEVLKRKKKKKEKEAMIS